MGIIWRNICQGDCSSSLEVLVPIRGEFEHRVNDSLPLIGIIWRDCRQPLCCGLLLVPVWARCKLEQRVDNNFSLIRTAIGERLGRRRSDSSTRLSLLVVSFGSASIMA